MMDANTKWPEVREMKSRKYPMLLMRKIFVIHRLPAVIVPDNGKSFVS